MRIFETYRQLNQALNMPAMEPGAYRFMKAPDYAKHWGKQ